MSRGEFAILLAVPLAAVGIGWWVHVGAGVVVFALGLAALGWIDLRYAEPEPEPEAESDPAEDAV